MQQYHDIYLKTDTILLADVFESFRDVSLRQYRLDAAHFVTAPGLSYFACLRMTEVHLELFTNIDHLLMIESGMRGGISYIANRYAKANNKFLPDFNPEEPLSHILYLDCTNLYGPAMAMRLLVGDFKFLSQQEINLFNVMHVPADSDYGYILTVDIDYPPHLHDDHNDYPLAPEHFQLTDRMLSSVARDITQQMGYKYKPVSKLVPNLNDKKQYTLHYRLAQFYVRHGLIITHVHRVMKFRQQAWLKTY